MRCARLVSERQKNHWAKIPGLSEPARPLVVISDFFAISTSFFFLFSFCLRKKTRCNISFDISCEAGLEISLLSLATHNFVFFLLSFSFSWKVGFCQVYSRFPVPAFIICKCWYATRFVRRVLNLTCCINGFHQLIRESACYGGLVSLTILSYS